MKKTTSFSRVKGASIAIMCSILPMQAMWHKYTQDYLIEPTKKYIIKPIVNNPKTSIGIGFGLGTIGFIGYTYYQNAQQKREKSIVALQALVRRYNERKNYENIKQNAEKMASILEPVKKGYNVRKAYQEMVNKMVNNNATILQSAARGFLAREEYKPGNASEIVIEICKRNKNSNYQIFKGERLSKRNYLIADILHLINTKTNDILDEFRKQYQSQNFDNYFSNIAKIILSESPIAALQNYDNKQNHNSCGDQILFHIGRLLQPDLKEKRTTRQLINGVWTVFDPDGYALVAPTLEELLSIQKWLLNEKTDKNTIIKQVTPEIYSDIAKTIVTKFMFNLGASVNGLREISLGNIVVNASDFIIDFFPDAKNQTEKNNYSYSHFGPKFSLKLWYAHECTYQYDEKKCDNFTIFINQHDELKSFFKTINNNKSALSNIITLKIPNTDTCAQSMRDYIEIKTKKDSMLKQCCKHFLINLND